MVLAETMIVSPEADESQNAVDQDICVSEMLVDQDPEAEESFRNIGSISTPACSENTHQLFQDIFLSWETQETLAE